MITCELEQAPGYIALSYTWGPASQMAHSSWYLVDSSDSSSFDYSAAEEHLGLRRGDRSADDADQRYIRCDGKELKVTQSLFDALKALRRSGHQDYYWIDAVCINQARHPNNTEKVAQIHHMRRIYERASRIIIWLGPPCRLLKDFAWVSEKLPRQFLHIQSEQLLDLQRLPLLWENLTSPQLAQKLGLNGRADLLRRVRNFALFCEERSWFSRVWTVQEAASVPTEIEMLCGRTRVSYQSACFMGYLIEHGIWRQDVNATRSGRSQSIIRGANLAERMAFELYYRTIAEETQSSRISDRIAYIFGGQHDAEKSVAGLAYMVLKARRFECTDPRDKLYAVLAFLRPLLHHQVREHIPVDYGQSVEEVYINLAEVVLTLAPRLGLLSFAAATASERRNGLPSWVPDLMIKAKEPKDGRMQPLVDIFESSVYNAMNCTDATRRVFRRIEASHLVCEGAIFDEISVVCEASNKQTLNRRQLKHLFTFAETLPPLIGGIDRIEALWRTWSGNYCCDYVNSIEYYPMQDISGTDFRYLLEDLIVQEIVIDGVPDGVGQTYPAIFGRLNPLNIPNALPDPADVGLRILQTVCTQTYQSPHEFETLRYGTSLQHIAHGRRLFLSRRGFLGMGPTSIEVGHKICFCYDSIVPLIVRDSSVGDAPLETVELVGDCYLHGYMNGEVLTLGNFQSQIREIQIV